MSSPADYYSVLRRATSALDPNTEDARHAVYDRARQAIIDARLSPEQMASERTALEAAIARLEEQATPGRAAPPMSAPRRRPAAPPGEPSPRIAPRRVAGLSPALLAVLATAVVLIAAFLGYALWPRGAVPDGPATRADVPARTAAPEQPRPATRPDAPAQTATPARPGEPAGAAPGRSFIFNRQLVYYRSIHPAGTLVVS